jgi:hypothetical protein
MAIALESHQVLPSPASRDEDVIDDIFALTIRAGELLEYVCLDRDAVDIAMRVLVNAMDLREYNGLDELKWEEAQPWSAERILARQAEVFEELASAKRIEPWRTFFLNCNRPNFSHLTWFAPQLDSYAYGGASLTDEGLRTIEGIRRVIDVAKNALRADDADGSTAPILRKIVLAAEGRLALDENLDVTPEQLAALAGIGIKSMRNELTPKSVSGLIKGKNDTITAASALNWLTAKGKFKPSTWRESSSDVERAIPVESEVLFVPFANAHTEFHPVICRQDGKYTVGPKGFEETFTNYRLALARLARMRPAPCWKHPVKEGKSNTLRTVIGVGFRPRTVADLAAVGPDASGYLRVYWWLQKRLSEAETSKKKEEIKRIKDRNDQEWQKYNAEFVRLTETLLKVTADVGEPAAPCNQGGDNG